MPTTYLAFGPSLAILDNDPQWLDDIRQELASIALAVARFEPVTVLVREHEQTLARAYMGEQVSYAVCDVDDFWLRDTGCVFTRSSAAPDAPARAVDLNFNGWGGKQTHEHDRRVAQRMAALAGVPCVASSLTLEGGALEFDGVGTAMLTRSCVLNANRNPGKSAADVQAELQRLFGVTHTIWLPGSCSEYDITDGHIDFYARFVRPGAVVAQMAPTYWGKKEHDLSLHHVDLLRQSVDARGQALQVHVLQPPRKGKTRLYQDPKTRGEAAEGYANFYVCSGAVLLPEFGDAERDRAAQDLLQTLYPDKEIVALNIDGIAAAGGGIHCVTQEGLPGSSCC